MVDSTKVDRLYWSIERFWWCWSRCWRWLLIALLELLRVLVVEACLFDFSIILFMAISLFDCIDSVLPCARTLKSNAMMREIWTEDAITKKGQFHQSSSFSNFLQSDTISSKSAR